MVNSTRRALLTRPVALFVRAGRSKGSASTHDLEFHHVTARAKGGKALTVEHVKVACRGHNVLEACRDFGDEVMLRYSRRGRRRAGVTTDANGRDAPAASTT